MKSENKVKWVCVELGITQKELAEELGVTQNTVTNWAQGKVDPPAIVLKCLELFIENKKYKEIASLSRRLNQLLKELEDV